MGYLRIALTTVLIVAAFGMAVLSAGCPAREPGSTTTTTIASTPTTSREGRNTVYPQQISGLRQPAAVAFAPDGRIFITQRTGQIRVFEDGELQEQPYATVAVPGLLGYHETGLLGIAIPNDFEALPYVYVYHTYSRNGVLANRVVRFRDDASSDKRPEVIFDRIPGGRIHDGGIVRFGPDNNLYISTGETGNSELAQDRTSPAGKILRLTPDGGIPSDNPFPGSPVYSFGHRNVFGMAFHPTNRSLYITENGPSQNDEVNRIEAGGNYGWPEFTGDADTRGFIDPLTTYTPNIAPTQAIFYTGNDFPQLKDRFIFGAYNTGDIHALELSENGDRVSDEDIIFNAGQPAIGVAQSPAGGLYVISGSSIRRITSLRE